MPAGDTSQIAAAAALLLRPPDAQTVGLLADGPVDDRALAAARQDYWGLLCIPRSGRFVPPYEHVLRNAYRQGRLWFFPPACYDGGDSVARLFAGFGFDPQKLDVDPVWASPHLPADHLGFLLAFVAAILGALEQDTEREAPTEAGEALARFVSHHLGRWTEIHAELVADRGGAFLGAVSRAVREAVHLARRAVEVPPLGEKRGTTLRTDRPLMRASTGALGPCSPSCRRSLPRG